VNRRTQCPPIRQIATSAEPSGPRKMTAEATRAAARAPGQSYCSGAVTSSDPPCRGGHRFRAEEYLRNFRRQGRFDRFSLVAKMHLVFSSRLRKRRLLQATENHLTGIWFELTLKSLPVENGLEYVPSNGTGRPPCISGLPGVGPWRLIGHAAIGYSEFRY
jgi:hypothetical protein